MADNTNTDDRIKFPRATTPKGKANYPWLNTPDTRFNKTGVYQARLVLPLATAQPLMDALDAMSEKVYQATMAKRTVAMEKKKKLEKQVPYIVLCDETTGVDTGDVSFAFKLNAKVVYKDKKTGEEKTLEFKPKFFDAAGTVIVKPPLVYAGSILRINYEPSSYYVAGTSCCGVSLRIHGIQIVKLVTSGGNNETAKDMGFGAEDDGYVADAFEGGPAGSGSDTPPVQDKGNPEDF